jgi:hypothetical protein
MWVTGNAFSSRISNCRRTTSEHKRRQYYSYTLSLQRLASAHLRKVFEAQLRE